MIKYGEIKNLINGIFKFRQKISDDTELTPKEIIDCKIFPIFRENVNPLLTLNGIKLENISNEATINDISVWWQTLDSIEIIASTDEINSKGGIINLHTNANFSIHSLKNGVEKIEKNISAIVRSNYTSNTLNCKIDKDTLFIEKKLDENDNIIDISTSYNYGRTRKTAVKQIKQNGNKISDWLLKAEDITSITLQSNIDTISKDGGTINLKVLKNAIRCYYKIDSNDKIIDETKEEEYVEDITSLCTFDVLGVSYVKILGSHLLVDKQPVGGESRNFDVIARFDKYFSTKKIYQNCGGVISYDYTFDYLSNSNKTDKVEFPTALLADAYIPITFTKNKYVDGKLIGKIPVSPNQITIKESSTLEETNDHSYNNDWCDIHVDVKDNNLFIHVIIKSNNTSKVSSKTLMLDIFGADKVLHLDVIQPCLKIIRDEIHLKISGETSYTKETIQYNQFDYIPLIKHIYEDDTYEEEIALNEDMTIVTDIDNSCEAFIPRSLYDSDFNGRKTLVFDVKDNLLPEIEYSFTVNGKIIRQETNEYICGADTSLTVTYYPQRVYKEYIFATDDKKITINDEAIINVKSILNKTVENSLNDEKNIITQDINFEIETDENCAFNIVKENNNIKIATNSVNKTNQAISSFIKLIQNDSNKILIIEIIQEPYINKEINVKLQVIVCKEDIDTELWSSSSILYIKKNDITLYSLQLSPCWLYPEMEVKEDLIYNGTIALTYDETFSFITSGFKIKKPEGLNEKDYNFNEKVDLTKNDTDLTFFIDL